MPENHTSVSQKMIELTSRGGLISAYRLDGRGGGTEITWEAIDADPMGDRLKGDIWVHLDRTGTHARQWVETSARLPPSAVRALLEVDPRPRFTYYPAGDVSPEGVVFVLRGVNLNAESEPEDMISIRLWIDKNRVITTRKREIMAVEDRRQDLLRGSGPKESVDVLLGINESLLMRLEPVLDAMDAELSAYEGEGERPSIAFVRTSIAALRRKIVIIRRYLAPQRDALLLAEREMPQWTGRNVRHSIHDSAIGLARVVDHLDEMRDRAKAVQDELALMENQRTARITMRLTVIAAIFLPANVIAAIWGMNTGGLPFGAHSYGFWIVLGIVVVVASAGVFVGRRLLH